jgi:PTS system glucose-specific IIC component
MQAIFGPRSENLKTEMEDYLKSAADTRAPAGDGEVVRRVRAYITALGGAANIVRVEDCAETRLRIVVRDQGRVHESALKAEGVVGVVKVDNRTLHLLIDLDVAKYAAEIERQLGIGLSGGANAA